MKLNNIFIKKYSHFVSDKCKFLLDITYEKYITLPNIKANKTSEIGISKNCVWFYKAFDFINHLFPVQLLGRLIFFSWLPPPHRSEMERNKKGQKLNVAKRKKLEFKTILFRLLSTPIDSN